MKSFPLQIYPWDEVLEESLQAGGCARVILVPNALLMVTPAATDLPTAAGSTTSVSLQIRRERLASQYSYNGHFSDGE